MNAVRFIAQTRQFTPRVAYICFWKNTGPLKKYETVAILAMLYWTCASQPVKQLKGGELVHAAPSWNNSTQKSAKPA